MAKVELEANDSKRWNPIWRYMEPQCMPAFNHKLVEHETSNVMWCTVALKLCVTPIHCLGGGHYQVGSTWQSPCKGAAMTT